MLTNLYKIYINSYELEQISTKLTKICLQIFIIYTNLFDICNNFSEKYTHGVYVSQKFSVSKKIL